MAVVEQTLAPLSIQNSRLTVEAAEKAVTALVKFSEEKSKTEKPKLLEDDEFLYLIVSLKKIPEKGRTKPFRVSIPHALMNPVEDSREICLIMDDRPKSNCTKDDAKKKIKSESIPIDKVIKLSKLRSDYRPFEAKRKLCDSYDMFFADRRVIPLLPKLLGKQFFKRKKIPLTIDLKHKNWKEQIEKACGAALFYVRMGTCSVVKIGKLSMGSNEIAENVVEAVNGIAEIVPGKWKNIRSFHLKLSDSVALPIYQTLPDLKLKIVASAIDSDAKAQIEVEKLGSDTVNDGDKITDESNSVKKKKKKGRIHEVRYMDSNVSEMLDEEEIGPDGEDTEKDETGIDETGVAETAVDEAGDDEMGIDETEVKKRKRVKQAKSEESAKRKSRKPEKSEKPAITKKALKIEKPATTKKALQIEKPAKKVAKVKKEMVKDGLKPKIQKKVREEAGELRKKPNKISWKM